MQAFEDVEEGLSNDSASSLCTIPNGPFTHSGGEHSGGTVYMSFNVG